MWCEKMGEVQGNSMMCGLQGWRMVLPLTEYAKSELPLNILKKC